MVIEYIPYCSYTILFVYFLFTQSFKHFSHTVGQDLYQTVGQNSKKNGCSGSCGASIIQQLNHILYQNMISAIEKNSKSRAGCGWLVKNVINQVAQLISIKVSNVLKDGRKPAKYISRTRTFWPREQASPKSRAKVEFLIPHFCIFCVFKAIPPQVTMPCLVAYLGWTLADLNLTFSVAFVC